MTANKRHNREEQRVLLEAYQISEEIMVDVEAHEKICTCSNKERPKIGAEITEKLDIVPATLKVIRYVRPK